MRILAGGVPFAQDLGRGGVQQSEKGRGRALCLLEIGTHLRQGQRMTLVLAEGRRLCEGTALLRELTPRTLDAISSLGERLCAPLVAAAVRELGLPSEAIEATELIVTDSFHGGAEPQMELTRAKSQARLRPLLEKR